MNPDALLQAANPLPDPDAAVDLHRRDELRARLLATPVPARRIRVPARRLALAAVALAAGGVGLLAAGERGAAPDRLAVLPALAKQLTAEGRILHQRTRLTRFDADGRPTGRPRDEEQWTLLDDARFVRVRITTVDGHREFAKDDRGQREYEPKTNTVTVWPYPTALCPEQLGGMPAEPIHELAVARWVRDAASGRIRVIDRPVIDGRPTLRIEGEQGWMLYIAEDPPAVVRTEGPRTPDGFSRMDYPTFEILPATAENRQLLEIPTPPDVRTVTEMPKLPKGCAPGSRR